jgi:hypothetical protein
MDNIKNFNNYLFEGQREQKKIDELLDISTSRRLTDEEKDILRRLSAGEKLPAEFDKKKDENTGEFLTNKGKRVSADKIEQKLNAAGTLNARIYSRHNSPERFILVFSNEIDHWFIYSTGDPNKTPLGVFLNKESPLYVENYQGKSPEQVWNFCDKKYDYGMILDDDLFNLFNELLNLGKKPVENRTRIIQIRERFLKLL